MNRVEDVMRLREKGRNEWLFNEDSTQTHSQKSLRKFLVGRKINRAKTEQGRIKWLPRKFYFFFLFLRQ